MVVILKAAIKMNILYPLCKHSSAKTHWFDFRLTPGQLYKMFAFMPKQEKMIFPVVHKEHPKPLQEVLMLLMLFIVLIMS